MKIKRNNLILEGRYQYIMQTSLYPLLRAAGFRKFGPCYGKTQGDFICEVFIEDHEQTASIDCIRIIIHITVCCAKEIAAKLPFPLRTPILKGKISYLSDELPDSFYIRDTDHWERDDQKILKALQAYISEYLLPFFSEINNLEDILAVYDKYLAHPWDFPGSVAQTQEAKEYVYYMLGDKKQCSEILEELIETSRFPSFRTRIEELQKLLDSYE